MIGTLSWAEVGFAGKKRSPPKATRRVDWIVLTTVSGSLPRRTEQGCYSLPSESCLMSDVLIAFCTFPNCEVAEKVANAVVEQNLAACANILPAARSIFRWEG